MAVYKDKERGTWYSSFHYVDWTGKNCRKLKREFTSKKEAIEWETHFVLEKASTMDMTFEDFTRVYEADVKPKLKENTWMTKENVIRTKLIHTLRIRKWQISMQEILFSGRTSQKRRRGKKLWMK